MKVFKPTLANIEDTKQLLRSSGSAGTNYIEAREGLIRKDFLRSLKISRKEAKESIYWLKLIAETNQIEDSSGIDTLIPEAEELKRI